jgi:hypothetical protein
MIALITLALFFPNYNAFGKLNALGAKQFSI